MIVFTSLVTRLLPHENMNKKRRYKPGNSGHSGIAEDDSRSETHRKYPISIAELQSHNEDAVVVRRKRSNDLSPFPSFEVPNLNEKRSRTSEFWASCKKRLSLHSTIKARKVSAKVANEACLICYFAIVTIADIVFAVYIYDRYKHEARPFPFTDIKQYVIGE